MNGKQFRGWLVILFIFISFFAFSARDYVPKHSIYNEGTYGTSHLRETLESFNQFNISRFLISPFGFSDNINNISMIVIIGSERSYTQVEIDTYKEFVKSGGTLLIFEDFGPARKIVESFGISYFQGVIRETNPSAMVNRPTQFFVKDIITPLLFGLNFSLYVLVNDAAPVFDVAFLSQQAIPILLTLDSAYIDINNNNKIEPKDRDIDGGIPVGLMKRYEKGLIVTISDASIPLNMYYKSQVDINGVNYPVPNILWSSLMMYSLGLYSNTTNLVFDESHQEIILSSTSGVLNLLSSTWIGIINSQFSLSIFALGILSIGIIANRQVFDRLLQKTRGTYRRKIEIRDSYISHPSLAERSISEQYILFNRFNAGFIQIANSNLINQIKETHKADGFVKELENEYGNLSENRSVSELLEIHHRLRDFVDEHLTKWL